MKIQAYKIDEFLNNSLTNIQAVLLYGPDKGLAQERAKIIRDKILGSDPDPFLIAALEGKTVNNNPAAFVDEFNAMSLVPGRRLIKISNADNNLAKTIDEALTEPKSDSFVIILAGDLTTSSKLRSIFEKGKNLVALPCYADDTQTASNIIAQQLRDAGLNFDRNIPLYIGQQFAGDRLIIRSEVEKLITYMGTEKNITIDDVENIICPIKEDNYQEIANAVADLNLLEIEKSISRHIAQNVYPVSIMRVVANYFAKLLYAKSLMNEGLNAAEAVGKLRPPLFFKQKPIFMKHLQIWNEPFIKKLLDKLQALEADCKTSSNFPADVMLTDLLIKAAYSVRARKRAA
jgi:DNA polymerase-3 subunit delta